jgi:hypothetical protein
MEKKLCPCIAQVNIKKAAFNGGIYRFNTILIKFPAVFHTKHDQAIQTFKWKGTTTSKTILKMNPNKAYYTLTLIMTL